MKSMLYKILSFIRKSLVRLCFFLSIFTFLQLAQFHEIYKRVESIEKTDLKKISTMEKVSPADEAKETIDVFVEKNSAAQFVSSDHETKNVYLFFDSYLEEWKNLAGIDLWIFPKEIYREFKSPLYSKVMSHFYPAIALTPLSVVCALYGYLLMALFFLLLKLVALACFKKSKETKKIKNEEVQEL